MNMRNNEHRSDSTSLNTKSTTNKPTQFFVGQPQFIFGLEFSQHNIVLTGITCLFRIYSLHGLLLFFSCGWHTQPTPTFQHSYHIHIQRVLIIHLFSLPNEKIAQYDLHNQPMCIYLLCIS
jgi:hypothetical protein